MKFVVSPPPRAFDLRSSRKDDLRIRIIKSLIKYALICEFDGIFAKSNITTFGNEQSCPT